MQSTLELPGLAPAAGAAWSRLLLALEPHRADGIVVAFSGGLDSSVLLDAALAALGPDRVVAFTAVSPSLPAREREEARAIAAELGARHVERETHELERPDYVANGGDRCYHCKSELFDAIHAAAADLGLTRVAYGYHRDDDADVRPGLRAAVEAGAFRPLWEAGLRKGDLRAVARSRARSFAEKATSACLASRIPVGTPVTAERLSKVEALEAFLKDRGYRQVRARLEREDLVRIETGRDELPRLLSDMADARERESLFAAARACGVARVSVDLAGWSRPGEDA